MGLPAILVMWPTSSEQSLFPDHNGSTWNLTDVSSSLGADVWKY